MTGLMMKYFVLNPTKADAYGDASREALVAYRDAVMDLNPTLARDLTRWLRQIEQEAEEQFREDEKRRFQQENEGYE